MLQLLLACSTLSTCYKSDIVETCTMKAIHSGKSNVWLTIQNIALHALKPTEEEINFIDEALRYAIMEGNEPTGTFYVRRNPQGEIEFEWNVPNAQILHLPMEESTYQNDNCWKAPLVGPSFLFHEIHYKAGYVYLSNLWEHVAAERFKLTSIDNSNQTINTPIQKREPLCKL